MAKGNDGKPFHKGLTKQSLRQDCVLVCINFPLKNLMKKGTKEKGQH